MKKLLFLTLLCISALAGCSKDSPGGDSGDNSDYEEGGKYNPIYVRVSINSIEYQSYRTYELYKEVNKISNGKDGYYFASDSVATENGNYYLTIGCDLLYSNSRYGVAIDEYYKHIGEFKKVCSYVGMNPLAVDQSTEGLSLNEVKEDLLSEQYDIQHIDDDGLYYTVRVSHNFTKYDYSLVATELRYTGNINMTYHLTYNTAIHTYIKEIPTDYVAESNVTINEDYIDTFKTIIEDIINKKVSGHTITYN